jgi:hypothetical protein
LSCLIEGFMLKIIIDKNDQSTQKNQLDLIFELT